jgi:hypothetical protein
MQAVRTAGAAAVTEPPIPPMSMEELHDVCDALSWGFVALARATGARESTTTRWWSGARAVPLPAAAWLRTVAAFHRANPAPIPPPYIPAIRDTEDDETAG